MQALHGAGDEYVAVRRCIGQVTFWGRCPLSVEYLDRVVDAEDYIQLQKS